MDDFTLSLSGGYPYEEVIVGGDCNFGHDDLSPDVSHFIKEEVIFDDLELEDGGLTSSSDDFRSSPSSSHHEEDEVIKIKAESDDEDPETLSMSVNVDFDKLDRQKLLAKSKRYVFVTADDGKTAEAEFFEDIGKQIIVLM